METLHLRQGRPGDASQLAHLVNIAGEGLAYHFWSRTARPGQDPWEVGTARIAGEDAMASHRNAVIADIGGAVAGALIAVRKGREAEDPSEVPPVIQPLVRLENRVLGSFYINVLAVHEDYRRRGIGRRLLDEAERRAGGSGPLSLIAASSNTAALALYRGAGFQEAARAPVITDGWVTDATDWLLMVKDLG